MQPIEGIEGVSDMRGDSTVFRRSCSSRLWIRIAVAVALFGVILRFYHLDWKVYSFDETVTSIRASGHSIAEFQHFVNDGNVHRLTDLSKFQHYDPATSMLSTVTSLAKEEPQHPPLYFIISRIMSAGGANSIWLRRLPAAIFAALLIPAFWWLSFELFRSRATAWLGSSLIALSPFHVAYAQQDREYSLWALALVVSSTSLLYALRLSTRSAWLIYAISMAVSLWIYTLSLYVLLAHAVFMLFAFKAERSDRAWFALTAGGALLMFTPWLFAIASNSAKISSTTTWDSVKLPLKVMGAKWLFNFVAVFFDLDYLSLRFLPVVALVAVLIIVSTVSLIRHATPKASKFVLLFGGITAFAMLVPDLLLGQSHSTQARYLTPVWLAVELAVAYAAGVGGWSAAAAPKQALTWRAAVIVLAFVSVASCIVSSQARYWWLASDAKSIPAIAEALKARGSEGLIAYAADDFYLLELSDIVSGPIRFRQGTVFRDNRFRLEPFLYLIGKPAQMTGVETAIEPRRLRRITIPSLFPKQDMSVQGLRFEGAVARKATQTLDDVALWTIPSDDRPHRSNARPVAIYAGVQKIDSAHDR